MRRYGRDGEKMEFGVFDHLDRYGGALADYYEDRLKIAEAYDRAGFYAYHIAEHHATPPGMAPSPSVFLAAVAQRTTRLRFGPLVWPMPLHHPLRLIEEICMLDQLSGGRLELGFGRGAAPIELEYYGIDPQDAQEIYAEAVELVLEGLTHKVLDFKGRRFSFSGVPMEIEPLQKPHPPIWYGVHAPESAERPARRNLNVVSLDPPNETRLSMDRYRTIWPQVHARTSAFPKLGLGRFIVVAPSDAAALALARRAYLVWHASFTHLFRRHGRPQSHPRPATFGRARPGHRRLAGNGGSIPRLPARRNRLQLRGRTIRLRRLDAGGKPAVHRPLRRRGDTAPAREGHRRRDGNGRHCGAWAPLISSLSPTSLPELPFEHDGVKSSSAGGRRGRDLHRCGRLRRDDRGASPRKDAHNSGAARHRRGEWGDEGWRAVLPRALFPSRYDRCDQHHFGADGGALRAPYHARLPRHLRDRPRQSAGILQPLLSPPPAIDRARPAL